MAMLRRYNTLFKKSSYPMPLLLLGYKGGGESSVIEQATYSSLADPDSVPLLYFKTARPRPSL